MILTLTDGKVCEVSLSHKLKGLRAVEIKFTKEDVELARKSTRRDVGNLISNLNLIRAKNSSFVIPHVDDLISGAVLKDNNGKNSPLTPTLHYGIMHPLVKQ